MNEPNKLECYIMLGWKAFPWTNSLAYWTMYKLQRKWSVVNTAPDALVSKLSGFMNPTGGAVNLPISLDKQFS